MAKLIIKRVSLSKGINQSRLQLDARVTAPQLNRYWNNKVSNVDLNVLEKIANVLGVSPESLIVSDEKFAELVDEDEDEGVA